MRIAFENIGSEAGMTPEAIEQRRRRGPAFATPVTRLADAWCSLVAVPPWPWLARARGVVPWLSTPSAAAYARVHKVSLFGAEPTVVAGVHDKAFAARIAQQQRIDPELVDLVLVLDELPRSGQEIQEAIARWPAWARKDFTLKPRWGTSGRGRGRGVDGRVHAWPTTRGGSADVPRGCLVEPWLKRELDLSSLWVVDEHGHVELMGTTQQVTRATGLYLGCDVTWDGVAFMAGTTWDQPAIARARVVVEAAAAAGYRGPCGVDALVYRDDAGALQLRGVVELNARFTAGHVALALIARAQPTAASRWRFRLDSDDVVHENSRVDVR